MMVPIRIPMVSVTRIVRVYARRLAFKRTQKALARWSIVNFLQICVLKIIPFRHLQVIQLRRAEETIRTGLINGFERARLQEPALSKAEGCRPEPHKHGA